MLEVGAPCAGKGGFPGPIKPKKECIKSCEICFTNTLNLSDKGPSMKSVCFPKVLWSFSYLTLTQNKPSEFFECYLFDYYCLTMIVQIKPIKACQGKGQGALPLREWLFSPFSSTGLSSLCEFVSSQPQCHRHCLPVSESICLMKPHSSEHQRKEKQRLIKGREM